MNKPRETFHFDPQIQNNGDWMLGLTSLQVYKSIFKTTEDNNQFELYKLPDEKGGGVSFIKVKDEIERDLDVSEITASVLQDDIIGRIIFEECREQVTKE